MLQTQEFCDVLILRQLPKSYATLPTFVASDPLFPIGMKIPKSIRPPPCGAHAGRLLSQGRTTGSPELFCWINPQSRWLFLIISSARGLCGRTTCHRYE